MKYTFKEIVVTSMPVDIPFGSIVTRVEKGFMNDNNRFCPIRPEGSENRAWRISYLEQEKENDAKG